jgi:coenzyme F420-reducing hydrogenase alpha subunit
MLHAPDFLGYPDAIAMAREHGDAVQRALALKKTGNDLLRLLGGREIHDPCISCAAHFLKFEVHRA